MTRYPEILRRLVLEAMRRGESPKDLAAGVWFPKPMQPSERTIRRWAREADESRHAVKTEEERLGELHARFAVKAFLQDIKPMHPSESTVEEEISNKYHLPYPRSPKDRTGSALAECFRKLDEDGVLLNWRIHKSIDWKEVEELLVEGMRADGFFARAARVARNAGLLSPEGRVAFSSLLNELRILGRLQSRIQERLKAAGWRVAADGQLKEISAGHRSKEFKTKMIEGLYDYLKQHHPETSKRAALATWNPKDLREDIQALLEPYFDLTLGQVRAAIDNLNNRR